MICEICLIDNAEMRGIKCGKYRVCYPCIDNAIEGRMSLLGRSKND